MKYLILFILSVPFVVNAQSGKKYSGFFGKKNVIEFNTTLTTPAWFNLLNIGSTEPYYNKNLKETSHVLDYGFRAGYSLALDNVIGIGFEYSMELQAIPAPEYTEIKYTQGGNFTYVDYTDVRHQKIHLRTHVFMPRLEFSSRSNLLPIGLSHQIGIGVSRTRVADRQYSYALYPYTSDSVVTVLGERGLVNTDIVQKGFVAMYQINMRTPINKSVTINYGFRYTANFMPVLSSTYALGQLDIDQKIKQKRNSSLIFFNVGIGYVF